ncbi:hypothetical protein [Actibacterium sp. MT2.3-13A]|uniref:hypothetical protein n=1 Tax=Actibacterium sp. MT2.3-13A TaxID=2828332 RepID=UPI001BA6E330|nr:hypothetical protein [Actibacterium sp. MT2.3-13A]
MIRLTAAFLAAALLAGCGEKPAPRAVPDRMPSYRSVIGNDVLPVPGKPGTFEVIAYAANDAEHFRCSGGSYVTKALGLLPNRRVYLVAPLGPSATRPGRRAITFTVLPDDALRTAAAALQEDHTLAMIRPGESFQAGAGASLCENIIPFFWDLPGA